MAAEANRAVRIVELLNETVNVGGFIYGELSALDQVMAINELEASGAISHAEALRQRTAVIAGAVRDGVIQAHGALREEPGAAERPRPAAERPQPAAEHPQPAAEHPRPAAEHPQPATTEHAEPATEEPVDNARRSRRHRERVAEPTPDAPTNSNIDAAIAALAAPESNEVDRNTAEAIRTGAVVLVPFSELVHVGGDHYTYAARDGSYTEDLHWGPGDLAMASAFGHRIYIDGNHPPEALRNELRHEVSHALHPHDHSGYHGRRPAEGHERIPDAAAGMARYADEFRAHYVEGRVGTDPETIRREILLNYPALREFYDSDPVFRARVDAMDRPVGNYLNSTRLAPIYTAMDVTDSHDARVGAAELRGMIERLNASDRELLRHDRRFDQWVTQQLDLPPADIEGIMHLLDQEPAAGNGNGNGSGSGNGGTTAGGNNSAGSEPTTPPTEDATGARDRESPAVESERGPVGEPRRSTVGAGQARVPRRVPRAEVQERSGPTNSGWSFELFVDVGDERLVWAHASVDEHGVVQNPDISSDHTIAGQPVRLTADGYSITDELTRRLEAAHTQGPINGYSVGFQQTNQTAFNRAHELARARGLSMEQADVVATAATPSGWIIVGQGFGAIEVPERTGEPGSYRVRVNLNRGPFPADLRPHLDAIRAQMRSERAQP